ncbi:polysaccharide deacetylase family protein [Clostridium sp. 19966]|uniref:polysaccharide deacetylase family protein n=1 Tax=Clostridium sp. 19966 TaxID=2768166 RepID=UPI0028EAE215|nr:polysaccharide deacetylase family protein [Clostridium sp. 19966]
MKKKHIRINKKRFLKTIGTVTALAIIFFIGFFSVNKLIENKKPKTAAVNVKSVQSAANNNTVPKNEVKENSANPAFTTNVPAGEYKPWQERRGDGKKIAYLTFDDGPSINTLKILNILKQNNIKATFFLIGKNAESNPDLVKEEIAEGHVVGNHTYSHPISYWKIGPEKLMEDVNHADRVLKSILGDEYNKKLVRFPGGYMGHGEVVTPYKEAMIKAGYHFVDWNDETGDADHNNVPVNMLVANLKKYTNIANSNTLVVLMHDAAAKSTSVQALPQVIEYLRGKGYDFGVLE